jgi:hypothetical protein
MSKILDPDLLTYIVDGSPVAQNLRFNTTNKTIQLVAGGSLVAKDGVTGQCLFSKIKEVIKNDADLIKYALPVREMIHDESMELVNGWTFYDATTLKMIRDCGVAYVNAAGAFTAMFACFYTNGAVLTGAPYFVQSSASNATTAAFTHVNIGASFGINELVQIYSDTNGDGTPDYDYRSYVKLFLREQGYTYSEQNNTEIGYPNLTYKKYVFALTHAVDAGVTKNDATVDAYTGMTITWYVGAQSASLGTNGPYNFHLLIDANGHTYDEVYSWVQRQLRRNVDIDAGAGNRTGQVAPALVFMDGQTLKTKLQAEGGVHIVNLSGSSLNNVAEADDTGAYRTYPYTASVSFEFDSYLQADGANGKFWIYDAATYPGAGATLLKDASNNDMTGTITGLTNGAKTFTYTYPGSDKNWIGVAVGKDQAKIAVASGTIAQSTGNKGVFVAGLERWYSNPV